jgi:cyclopropane fatty-acyl-phospholipid synthase-like methyltransferase
MFETLKTINSRPAPFAVYTAKDLWTDEHTSKQMLAYHLNEHVDLSSRRRSFIDRSVEWMTRYFGVGEGTSIVDFGCGPGLYTTRLAQAGARVTGVDFSERSIRYATEVAEKKGLRIDYRCQDYLTYQAEAKYDLITMIMCDFCALSPAQRRQMLSMFHGLLDDGGAVVLDVYTLHAFEQRQEATEFAFRQLAGFWSDSDYYGFLNTFKYDAEKVALDKYTIIEEARTRTVYNWLQYFSPEALEAEFAECGLTIEARFSDVAGTPFNPESPELAIVARRAQS